MKCNCFQAVLEGEPIQELNGTPGLCGGVILTCPKCGKSKAFPYDRERFFEIEEAD